MLARLFISTVLTGVLGGATLAQESWPEGKGKDVVSTICVSCHEARRFTAGGGFG